MHKIHHVSCYYPEFLGRVRDQRLTDPIVDLLGPDLLGLNNLYIWKAPKIGLGFPWHQDRTNALQFSANPDEVPIQWVRFLIGSAPKP